MPFIRVSYMENQCDEHQLSAISLAIHSAVVEHLNVPEDDYFQVFHAHKASEFFYSPNYLNIERSDELLYIQITLKSGRTTEQKTSFYAKAAELLSNAADIRKEDVFIVLVETEAEDWTFGNGVAQAIGRM